MKAHNISIPPSTVTPPKILKVRDSIHILNLYNAGANLAAVDAENLEIGLYSHSLEKVGAITIPEGRMGPCNGWLAEFDLFWSLTTDKLLLFYTQDGTVETKIKAPVSIGVCFEYQSSIYFISFGALGHQLFKVSNGTLIPEDVAFPSSVRMDDSVVIDFKPSTGQLMHFSYGRTVFKYNGNSFTRYHQFTNLNGPLRGFSSIPETDNHLILVSNIGDLSTTEVFLLDQNNHPIVSTAPLQLPDAGFLVTLDKETFAVASPRQKYLKTVSWAPL